MHAQRGALRFIFVSGSGIPTGKGELQVAPFFVVDLKATSPLSPPYR